MDKQVDPHASIRAHYWQIKYDEWRTYILAAIPAAFIAGLIVAHFWMPTIQIQQVPVEKIVTKQVVQQVDKPIYLDEAAYAAKAPTPAKWNAVNFPLIYVHCNNYVSNEPIHIRAANYTEAYGLPWCENVRIRVLRGSIEISATGKEPRLLQALTPENPASKVWHWNAAHTLTMLADFDIEMPPAKQ